jgi:trimeric autotransporter adhesin
MTTATLSTYAASAVPVQVMGLASGVSAISAGPTSTCAVVEGAAYCWGDNNEGQLGSTAAGGPTPGVVTGLGSGVETIATGGQFACAVLSGGVQCWGTNGSGQLGTGGMSTNPGPTPVQVKSLPAGSGVTALAAGFAHVCALLTGGVVQCWGANGFGQLGNGATTGVGTTPATVTLAGEARAITAGVDHTCALLTGGSIQCWGDNTSGQLGNTAMATTGTPVDVHGISTATAVAAGGLHTCAIVSGNVQCWGDDDDAQLGDGNTNTTSDRPVAGPFTMGVTAIAGGQDWTCAIVNGGVRCWGCDDTGQLGDNGAGDQTNASNSDVYNPVPVATSFPGG